MSHSDGPAGRLFFYLTPMDELFQNLAASPAVSYTVTEASATGCAKDPEVRVWVHIGVWMRAWVHNGGYVCA